MPVARETDGMAGLVPISSSVTIPAMVAHSGERAGVRFMEFFTAQIRNPHTLRAYARAAAEFLAWCQGVGVTSLSQVQPMHDACGGMDRALDQRKLRAHGEATSRGHSPPVRLAGNRPHRRRQSRRQDDAARDDPEEPEWLSRWGRAHEGLHDVASRLLDNRW